MFQQRPLKLFLYFFIGAGLFVSIFPWIFSYQGVVLGRNVSIRSVGDLSGVLLVLIGVAALLWRRVPDALQRFAVQMETINQKDFRTLIILLISLFSVAAISHKLRAHSMLSTHAFDLGFFSNVCWNTSQGDWFFSSVLERNFLAVHANWILWPLAFFYRLGMDARCLLFSQVLFMVSAVPILIITVRRITDSVCAALLAAMMFVCSPYFFHSLFNDFHPDAWQLPFLMAALWAYHRRRPYLLLLFCLLSLFAKEDVSVVLVGYSIFLLVQPKWRLTGGILLGLSIGIFLLQTLVIIPNFIDNQQQSLLFSRYTLGNSLSEIALSPIKHPSLFIHALFHQPVKFWRLACYLFPAAGLTLFAPYYLIPCVVSVLPHLISNASTQLSLADIYAMPSQPFIFIGAAVGFMNLMKKEWFSERAYQWAALCFMVAGLGVLNSPRTFRMMAKERLRTFGEIKLLVPTKASLVTQQHLYSHFDTRRNIQLFPIGQVMAGLQRQVLLNPDYIVCDRIGNALPFDEKQLAQNIQEIEKNPAYEKIFERDNFIVFRRRNTETMHWLVL